MKSIVKGKRWFIAFFGLIMFFCWFNFFFFNIVLMFVLFIYLFLILC